jgi:hypothetical protein
MNWLTWRQFRAAGAMVAAAPTRPGSYTTSTDSTRLTGPTGGDRAGAWPMAGT